MLTAIIPEDKVVITILRPLTLPRVHINTVSPLLRFIAWLGVFLIFLVKREKISPWQQMVYRLGDSPHEKFSFIYPLRTRVCWKKIFSLCLLVFFFFLTCDVKFTCCCCFLYYIYIFSNQARFWLSFRENSLYFFIYSNTIIKHLSFLKKNQESDI